MVRSLLIAVSFLVLFCLVPHIEAQLEEGDESEFVEDVTYPDGSKVKQGEELIKKWKLKNTGSVLWKGRALKATKSTEGDKDLEAIQQAEVPETKPGETCTIEAKLKAPQSKGTYKVTFKMVNDKGKECFPTKSGVYIEVEVQ